MLRLLLDRDEPHEGFHGDVVQRVRIESVALDVSGGDDEILVLMRDLNRPGGVFGWHFPAVGPEDVGLAYADSWVTVARANLIEDLQATGYGLPKECEPGVVNWF